MKSTIKLSDETKNVLKERKKDSRESYEDVIKRLLSESEPPSLSEMLMEAYHYLENRGVKNVQVFGSRLRGEETPESDLDLLVDFPEGTSLLDHVRMEMELSELIGVKVDLVPRSGVKPALQGRILGEAVDILKAKT